MSCKVAKRLSIRALLALLFVEAALADVPCPDVVCVEVEKSANAVTFYAVSRADAVTITFCVSAVGMEPASPPPLVRGLARGRTELMRLKAVRGKRSQFEHGYFWEWGLIGATHNDRVSYHLPYEARKAFRLYQGPDGALSHKEKAAYDFPMPLGTTVHATRAGLVIVVVDSARRETIPVRFRTADGDHIVLEEGKAYRAAEVQPASALH